ncbi:hypothetical protein DES40_2464 [Litorimonas taeanensis]|uniref:Uncharacterized protein n=1 Tax=Litorimonas taeanensis TaxID=568099 RepID=A0A420WF94_9PROT|nr:hypothetical protein [Litorimonas taeanensis]RKQ69660.1 hypothetical protein DES40_2464 [Litorimonas taeanensis]
MSENTLILITVVAAVLFFGLWRINTKQKRKFEEERRARKRDLAALKAKAAARNETPED